MSVHVKLSSTLRAYDPEYNPEKGLFKEIARPGHTTARDLARDMALPLDEIKFVMINGRYTPLDTVLRENDRVAYFPPVGGG